MLNRNRVRRVSQTLARKCAVALVVAVGFTTQSWAVPVNDLITNAIVLAPPSGTVIGTTADGATFDGAPFSGTSNTAPGVWYTFFGDGGVAAFDTNHPTTDYDTKVSIYSDFTGLVVNLTPVAGNDDGPDCSLAANIFCTGFSFPSLAGVQYYTLVHGFGSAVGNFGLNYSIGTPVPAIPLPAALPLFAGGLGLMGLLGWRRKQAATA